MVSVATGVTQAQQELRDILAKQMGQVSFYHVLDTCGCQIILPVQSDPGKHYLPSSVQAQWSELIISSGHCDVCLDVNQGGTNHNRCTQRSVILR